MKRVIALLLSAALLVSGLGSLAQASEGNVISVDFCTRWIYDAENDIFDNDTVTGHKEWDTNLQNILDTGEAVIATNLSLATALTFDRVGAEENLITDPPPPPYEWFFDDVSEGSERHAFVGTNIPGTFPVSFEPGFDATLELSETHFLQADGSEQLQTLLLTVTPRQAGMQHLTIGVGLGENDFVMPVHTTPITGDMHLSPDGVWLNIDIFEPVVGHAYDYTVTIDVTPKVPEIEFRPQVTIGYLEWLGQGTVGGSSVSGEAPDVGNWTWSSTENYTWNWQKQHRLLVNWYGISEQIGEPETAGHVYMSFDTHYSYNTPDDIFENHEVSGQRTWQTHLEHQTGGPSPNLPIDATVSLTSGLEFEFIDRNNMTTEDPAFYQWSYPGLSPGAGVHTGVGYHTSDPSPVSFEPGFNTSRAVDPTSFDEPGHQTLTITVTPQDEALTMFTVDVGVPQDGSITAYIDSCDAADYEIMDEGRALGIWEHAPLEDEYTYTITIWVEPGDYPVEIWPYVEVRTPLSAIGPNDVGTGSSYSKEVAELGEWTWNISEAHPLDIAEHEYGAIRWEPRFEELINDVQLRFSTNYVYTPPDDTFITQIVPCPRSWYTTLSNRLNISGDVIEKAMVSLTSGIEFEKITSHNLDSEDPPVYQWSYSGIGPGGEAEAGVVYGTSDPSPVSFNPGFNASRILDKTLFYEPGEQTLTITVTPQEELSGFKIDVWMPGGWPDVASIKSCDATDYELSLDGQRLAIRERAPGIGTLYTYTVIIEVVPGAHPVEFLPFVEITKHINSTPIIDAVPLSSYSQEVAALGEWIWEFRDTDGNPVEYPLSVVELVDFKMRWEPRCEELINDVFLNFGTNYVYIHLDDFFFNQEVPGHRMWSTLLYNRLGSPEGVIENATIGLETGMEFTSYDTENLVEDPPPPYQYQWSYNGIGPGVEIHTNVGFRPDDPSPVPFVPGFDISRTFSATRFEPGVTEPQWQTLTITVTPQDEMPPWFGINVRIPDEIPFTASIETCDGAADYHISPDGRRLQIGESFNDNPQANYIYTIEIRVEPGAHPVEFWPDVEIIASAGGTHNTYVGELDSFTKEIPDMGTWTWNLSSVYPVSASEDVTHHIAWEGHVEEFINYATVLFQTFQTHLASGDEFENGSDDVPGDISWVTQILSDPDNTGEPVANAVLDLATEEEFNRVSPLVPGPPYQWSYGDIPEGEIRWASVSFLPDPSDPNYFTPGFDVSRSVDQTMFSEPGTQTLTISVTPREDFVDMVIIDVFAMEDGNAIPTIRSVDGADGAYLNQDGHRLMIVKATPDIGTEYTVTVTIDITPKVPQVTYQPAVRIYDPGISVMDSVFDSSVTYEMPGVGTWTCSADGDYQWSWLVSNARAVVFPRDSRIVIAEFSIQHMSVDFDNLRPDRDRIAISEATITLGEAAAYDLTLDDVVVNIDGVVITIPAGSFVQKGTNECYHFESSNGAEPQINMELDFEKGEWRLKVSKIDAGAIDNSDGVKITLTIGNLSATELIDMQVGGLTFIASEE